MGLLDLRKQKAEALDYYVKTKDKNVRSHMRKLDKMIKKCNKGIAII